MTQIQNTTKVDASYKDPDGYCFKFQDKIYRAVNYSYKENYDLLMNGLYQKLTDKGYLISHLERNVSDFGVCEDICKILEPCQIDFITYPYEWSFSQLKDAALLTLKIQRTALNFGMTLKDASAYNVQFINGKAIFIDTLSFEKFKNKPWAAYNQFCKNFLAPLALMAYTDIRANLFLKDFIEGIPLDLAVKMLPLKARFNLSLFLNIFLQAKYQKKYENSDVNYGEKSYISKEKMIYLNESLQDCVYNLKLKNVKTQWGDYYSETNYDKTAFSDKKRIIEDYIDKIKPASLWDLGANNGYFTRIASARGINCLAFDIDPLACEKNYNQIKKNNEKYLTPVLFDLTNPSPSIGFGNEERQCLLNRKHPDAIMALALIHHLAISNNLPFDKIARYFRALSENLIIEFVPKKDSKVQKLLSTRQDIFDNYNEECFEKEFLKHYDLICKKNIKNSLRTLYLFKGKI